MSRTPTSIPQDTRPLLTDIASITRLLVLTFFFGGYWGTNLLNATFLTLSLLGAVTVGRLLGVVYIRWSAQAYGFTLIECYDQIEVRGITRILASMPDVMVEINGARYLWGVRVDDNPAFRRYLVAVEEGVYDHEDVSAERYARPTPSTKGSSVSSPTPEPKKPSPITTVNQLRASEEGTTPKYGERYGHSPSPPLSFDSGSLRPAPPARRTTTDSATVGRQYQQYGQGAPSSGGSGSHAPTWPLQQDSHGHGQGRGGEWQTSSRF